MSKRATHPIAKAVRRNLRREARRAAEAEADMSLPPSKPGRPVNWAVTVNGQAFALHCNNAGEVSVNGEVVADIHDRLGEVECRVVSAISKVAGNELWTEVERFAERSVRCRKPNAPAKNAAPEANPLAACRSHGIW